MHSLQPSIACLTQSFLNSIVKRLWCLAVLFFLAEVASAQTPANDNFSNRISLSGATVSTSGSNVNATSESGEPFNYSGRSSVWWSWTAPASGSVTIRTAGSNFDTTLAAFTGSSVAALTQITYNDDADGTYQSRIEFFATAGVAYQIQVSGYGSTSVGSINLSITQSGPATAPTITSHPASTTINSGSSTTLSVTATGTAPLTYQWYQGSSGSTTTPVGSNSASFTTPSLSVTTSYWVRVSNSAGSASSNTATVTVNAPAIAPSITSQPAAITINSGATTTLSVTASGTAPLSYQWYQGASGTTTTPVGTNSSSFTTPALTSNTSYWVRVSNPAGNASSNTATITVGPPPVAPSITTQPVSLSINSGSTANLSVVATGTPPLSYQWYQGPLGTTTNPLGANSSSFTTPALTTNTSYWVRVSNSIGSVESNLATVSVIVPPSITSQPASTEVDYSSSASLSVSAAGTGPLSYQWYQGSSGTTSSPVGSNSPSFTTPTLTSAASYWVRVSNSAGNASSDTATITVGPPPVAPSITTQPASISINSGSTANLSVVATGTSPLSYQWYQGSLGTTTTPVGTNSSSFTTPALTTNTSYWVRVSNSIGSVDSNLATVSVIVPPSITSQPASTTVAYSSSTTLSVSADGTGPLSYQWYQGSSGTTSSPVGSNSQSFTTPTLTSATSYWVRVSNSAGNASSDTATITVGPPPVAPSITTQPASTSVSVGNSATFSVIATGSEPLSYQWYQGTSGTTTTPVGSNSASFTTPALTTATATASYWVRVSNFLGAVNSNAATVTITVPVNIPDPALLAALRIALAKPTGDITDADLLTLTNLNIANKGITNLSGLEKATNLRVLDVRRNNFTDIEVLWTILDSLRLYCLYVDVRRPGVDPVGLVTQTLTDTSGNTFFVTVDAPNLPTLDFTSLSVDTTNPSNISALQTISSSGVTVDTGGINLPPFANAVASVVNEDTRQVLLSANGSSDVDGTITGYAWTWSGGSASGATSTVTLPYGTTPVTLTVTDNLGASGSSTVQVTIDRPYTEPAITNLSAVQRAGTRLVDIRYDVDAVTPMVATSVRVSSDRGVTFAVPATTLGGHFGPGVIPGSGKTITWDAGTDWPEQFSETVRFELGVNDGVGTPTGMALIPAGNFTMGRTSGDTDADAPPVEVTVSAFYMGKNEITKGLWDEVRTWAVANGFTDLAEGDGKAADHPVHSISWFDMVKWCNARSQKEGLTPSYTVSGAVMKTGSTAPTVDWTANGYRLPTEAEWEKAARGGKSGKRFPWGTDTISHSQANYRSSSLTTYDLSASVNNYHPTYATGSQPFTSPVGAFEPNPYGLHDMAGNVWEWCWDWAGGSYSTGATDPRGPTFGTGRIRRGGSWESDSSACRIAGRSSLAPSGAENAVGFRVARTPVASVIPPRITVQPASMSTVDSGVTLTVSATGTRPLSYQWYQGQVGTMTNPVGTNSPTYTTLPWTPTTSYWVRVSNAAGSVDSMAAVVDDFSEIPAGSFTMGRTSGDTISDAPPVTVTLSAFHIGKNEVSKELWDEVRNWAVANGYTDLSAGAGKARNHPVVGVSWWDVIKWCNARSEKEGLTPCYTVSDTVIRTGTTAPTVNWSANGYRLPTEAEWEKAARGGVSGKRFPWGTDTISQGQANYYANGAISYDVSGAVNNYHPIYATGSLPNTSPLGSFAATGYGLHDMAGNVSEWCWDWYGPSTYVSGTTEPRGAASGSQRVFRGGSWNNNAFDCRVGVRDYGIPSSSLDSLGFRLARTFVPSGSLAPAISIQPGSTSIIRGESATLNVSAGGANPLIYQWYQGSVGVTTTPVGTNSASFITPALNVARSYWVRVSNAVGSVNSALATVSVITPPVITTQPASTTIPSGSTATLTVTNSGTAPLTYQWYQGAVGTTTSPVGTNSASFTTAALTATTTFWVRVSNSAGNVNSALATVTVNPPAAPTGFSLIPGGSFAMGRTSGDDDFDARPVTVNVSAFYMGKNEVTKALWDEVRTWAAANGYTDLAVGAGKATNHPVQTVSWWHVVKWCNARSQKEGLTPVYTVSGAVMKTGTTAPTVNWSANGYRLPTEAEWEKAARGGVSGKRFPWGTDTISHSQANFNNKDGEAYRTGTTGYHPSYATGSMPYTSPVGAFAANAYGLHDMAGNVREWCWDWYGASTYVNGATDPRGASSGMIRVFRGGSWNDSAVNCRAANRSNSTARPTSRNNLVGFRIARSSVP